MGLLCSNKPIIIYAFCTQDEPESASY